MVSHDGMNMCFRLRKYGWFMWVVCIIPGMWFRFRSTGGFCRWYTCAFVFEIQVVSLGIICVVVFEVRAVSVGLSVFSFSKYGWFLFVVEHALSFLKHG